MLIPLCGMLSFILFASLASTHSLDLDSHLPGDVLPHFSIKSHCMLLRMMHLSSVVFTFVRMLALHPHLPKNCEFYEALDYVCFFFKTLLNSVSAMQHAITDGQERRRAGRREGGGEPS